MIPEIQACPPEEGHLFGLKARSTVDIDCDVNVRARTQEEAIAFLRASILDMSNVQWFVSCTDHKMPFAPDGDNDIDFEVTEIDEVQI